MTRKRTKAVFEDFPESAGLEYEINDERRRVRLPVAIEGLPFILGSLVVTALVFWLFGLNWPGALMSGVTLFVIAFFRDPERAVPAGDESIVSPADGKVIKVERIFDDRFLKAEARRISIFMTVFNVHVNRAPASARVLKVVYNPGRFFSANLDKASLENEQNAVVAEGPGGRTFVFNQIAGLVARRIVCRVKEGMRIRKGERFGLIRFGSRLDVYLPVECEIAVAVGDKVRAGSSILGYWR